jgi:predicted KAP-like P-loop ATPase
VWSDNETTIDYLNFGVVADACAKLLQQARGVPISVGISGGWGAGKSSLVRMIEDRLKKAETPGQNTYVVVTFNPWLYQDFEGARSALLQLVGDEVLRLAENNVPLLKKAKRLLQRINLLRLAQLGGEVAATLYTGVPVGSVGKAVLKVGGFFGLGGSDDQDDDDAKEEGGKDEEEKDKSDALIKPAEPVSLPNEIQAFRNALEELLEELKITLVVFVDDLDRCLPKTAISTLESIRLLLFLKRSAFVIAADNEFIRGAVRVHFEGTNISSDVATNYLDKLIQVPLHVPRLGINEAKAYLALLLMERANADGYFDDSHFKNALKAIPQRLQMSWRGDAVTTEFLQSLLGTGDTRMVQLMELAEGLAPLLTQSSAVNANPRLMKRFLNTVYLRSALAEPQGISLDIPSLAKWHLVERCNEVLASALGSLVTSASDGRVDALHVAEAIAADSEKALPEPFKDDAFTREWLQLRPALGETDLRPLLHLSRDTATRDFGADNMTPEGRALRDALVSATSSNAPLTQAITAAGAVQAQTAMIRAWQLKASKRSWRAGEDVVPLIEPCKVFPELGAKAASLLTDAPVAEVGPGIIPQLYAQTWARPVLDQWEASASVNKTTKAAIQRAKKGIQ